MSTPISPTPAIDSEDPKNYVTATVYSSNGTTVTVYSAEWCSSCNRIKAHFPDLFKDYTMTSETKMIKTDFKRDINNLIPFFTKHGRTTDKIQTSNPDVLRQFLEL